MLFVIAQGRVVDMQQGAMPKQVCAQRGVCVACTLHRECPCVCARVRLVGGGCGGWTAPLSAHSIILLFP